MKRRAVLVGLGTSVGGIAGCVRTGDGGQTDDGPTENGGENAGTAGSTPAGDHWVEGERPHCEIDPQTLEFERDDGENYETVGTIPYPKVPETFSEDSAVEFVEAHEAAFIRHRSLCQANSTNDVVHFTYGVEDNWIVADDNEWTVLLQYIGGATKGVDSNGFVWVADMGPTGVCYEINEEGIARANYTALPGLRERATIIEKMPDPVADGEFVIYFQ